MPAGRAGRGAALCAPPGPTEPPAALAPAPLHVRRAAAAASRPAPRGWRAGWRPCAPRRRRATASWASWRSCAGAGASSGTPARVRAPWRGSAAVLAAGRPPLRFCSLAPGGMAEALAAVAARALLCAAVSTLGSSPQQRRPPPCNPLALQMGSSMSTLPCPLPPTPARPRASSRGRNGTCCRRARSSCGCERLAPASWPCCCCSVWPPAPRARYTDCLRLVQTCMWEQAACSQMGGRKGSPGDACTQERPWSY